MPPSRTRLAIGTFSLSLLIILLASIPPLFLLKYEYDKIPQLEIFAIYIFLINAVLIFIWAGFGKITGLISSLIASVFIAILFAAHKISSSPFYFLTFALSGFIGYKLAYKFFILSQKYTVEIEKIDEDINLLGDKLKKDRQEIELLDRRLARYSNLSGFIERLSLSISKEDVIKSIVENTYGIFGRSDPEFRNFSGETSGPRRVSGEKDIIRGRVLFFLVDTKKQELGLAYSKKIRGTPYIKLKSGDIFDRWVFKKRQPLLVEDIQNDFRFSLEGQILNENFKSIISAPLVSKDKVLGILRMDSREKSFYSQEDLRLLDIISDLASVALENAILYKQVSDLAITDGLTSLYVHRYFKDRLANEIKRSLKTGKPFSLVMLDIDAFKDYNDRYGHTAGDLVLKHIAKSIRESISGGDIAARYGGEEFALILVGKNKEEALFLSESLRKHIEDTPVILRRKRTNITISGGISTCPEDSTLSEDLIRNADKRLYKAKEKGKNRICAQ